MNETSTLDNDVREVVKKIQQSLDGLDPAPFSSPAQAVFTERITDYLVDLVKESAANSKRDRTQSISVKHVEAAADYLGARASARIYQHLGTWGGIFLGFSLSAFWSMLQSHQYSTGQLSMAALTAIAGAFLLGLSFRAR